MKDNKLLKGLNYLFSLIGFLAISGIIFLFVSNIAGIGTFMSVLGLMKTQGLEEVGAAKLIEGATSGIVESLEDPYSRYLDAKTWKDLRERLEAKFGGIGVYVLQDNEGRLKIISPIKGTPAFKEGVKHGDIIIRINGKSAANMDDDDAVHLMRGEPGTQLILGVYRESDRSEHDFRIVREIIKVPSVEASLIEGEPDIGYVKLSQFHSRSTQEMNDSLNQFLEKDHIKGLIIDLRNNGGGDFDVSIAIASIFLDGKDVVSVVDRDGNKTVHRASGGKLDVPMVLLVNGDSASASEILAGALKDNKRALLVGEKTYGKGLVQTVFPLRNGGALKLTTQKYFTPDGIDINEVGINPDYVVKNDPNNDKDLQLNKAVEIIKTKI